MDTKKPHNFGVSDHTPHRFLIIKSIEPSLGIRTVLGNSVQVGEREKKVTSSAYVARMAVLNRISAKRALDAISGYLRHLLYPQ